MGELENWPVHQNGGDLSEFNMPTSPFRRNSSPNPQFEEIRGESWHVAERATEGVVQTIQATVVSEKRRQEVVEFVQRLIRGTLGCEVFPFGSVPLKTYLPDGDIDLTAFSMPNSDDSLSTNVLHVLQTKEHNNDSEFELKDVQFINAEVKLVKCLVQNIVVDISFNQSGGLSTLCFLERVDRMIGKDHLFKRSIILIKSWCYYESRILGAHHGLISTYALETLILYIFHLFHSSLDGPLAVLYRFLDYYSKFDWENFIVSLYGPIAVSSLPELVAESPENEGVDLLFTKEFLQSCVENLWVVPRAFESNFPQKHLNIVDPLRDYNNLGRSVNRGNFYRIRSAFSYGARKLGQLLVLPTESIAAQVKTFFANTLDRHGSGERPDVQGLSMYRIDRHSPPSESYASDATGELCEEMNGVKLNCFEDTISNVREKSKAPDFASGKSSSQNGKASHTPHLFFPSENGYQNGEHSESKRVPFNEEASVYCESESSTSSTSWFSTYGTSEQLEHLHPGESSSTRPEGNGTSGNTKRKKMADLTADYELHFRNLLYVRWSQEYLLGTLLPFHPQPLPPYQYHNNKHSWDSPRRHGLYSQMNTTALVPGIPFSPSGSGYPTPFASSGGYGMEDPPKPRGTGTYFPNTNSRSYRERYSPRRGKYSFSGNHFSRHHNNSRPRTPQDADLPERNFSEPLPQLQLPVFSESGRWESAVVDTPHSPHPFLETTSPSSGFVVAHDGKLEFGSFGPVALGSSSADVGNSSNSGTPSTQGPTLTFLAATVQRPSMNPNCEGSSQAYQLKDEEDFPPLAG